MTEQQLLNRLLNSFSYSKDGLVATTYADDAVVAGNAFVFEKNFTISNAVPTLYILFDYTTYVPSDGQIGQIFVYPPLFASSAGPVIVTVYTGTDYTGGTEFNAVNSNTLASKSTSGTTLTSGATGTTKGTPVLEYLVGTDTPGVSGPSGGGAGGLSFFITGNAVGDKTLVEINNNSGSDITFHYGQSLIEI